MKFIFSLVLYINLLFAGDATIVVSKQADSLPSLAIEDSSVGFDETFKMKFYKTVVADMNVLALFNVDRHRNVVDFESGSVALANKDMQYVVRYKLSADGSGALNLTMKLLKMGENVFSKTYKVGNKNTYMFISHGMAYDVNQFMGEPSIEWIKRKVMFSRIVAPKKSEIIIADYTLAYQHVILKGGFNVFPKWSNAEQTGIYYTSLDGRIPVLKHIDLSRSKITDIISSDGMMVCSDVSDDGKNLLLTMAKEGQSEIYTYNIATKKYKRETVYGGIDVNGQFMDNNNIVFVSSRLGYPNIFTKNLRTGEIEQLVYYGKNNSACSANGNYVVYKARETSATFGYNTFNIHLISTQTDAIRRLTATGMNEYPKFSKDGDAVIFLKTYKGELSVGIVRLNHNKTFLFPIRSGKFQSIDW